jgi:hypothetical protein
MISPFFIFDSHPIKLASEYATNHQHGGKSPAYSNIPHGFVLFRLFDKYFLTVLPREKP